MQASLYLADPSFCSYPTQRTQHLCLSHAASKAGENIEKNGLADRLQVVQASAFELPFEDAFFDIVINEAMLTMLTGDSKDRALAEYARVLKPGGVLLTQDVCFRCDDTAEQKELRAGLSRAINVNAEPLTRACWKERIESHGFATEQKVDCA